MKIGRWQESSSDGRRVASRSGSPLSSKRKEEAMINLKALGAVAITASALSSSAALAQAALSNPDACQAEFANCTGLGTGSTPTGGYRYRQSTPRTAYRQPAAAGATVGGWAIPTPCPARRAGTATGMRMLPATASSAGPAPISRVLTVSGIPANRFIRSEAKSDGLKGRSVSCRRVALVLSGPAWRQAGRRLSAS